MSQLEYIEILWRVIYVMGAIIAVLVGIVWKHIQHDRKRDIDLQKCKDALGINGR